MASARIVYLHALTPVHSGTGQTVAVIDLPVAREKITGWPIIPGSSLKGVLRDTPDLSGQGDAWIAEAFGEEDQAGALCFGDQHLLCFPVRSFYGTFAYTTCPLALRRFVRDLQALGLTPPIDTLPAPENELTALLPANNQIARNGKVYFEDLELTPKTDSAIGKAADALAKSIFDDPGERDDFVQRFAILSDTAFGYLCEIGTEVVARVRLGDDSKTVEQGGLWYEEAVPAETIFWGPVTVADHRRTKAARYLEPLTSTVVQIGGNATVGRGLCRVRFAQ